MYSEMSVLNQAESLVVNTDTSTVIASDIWQMLNHVLLNSADSLPWSTTTELIDYDIHDVRVISYEGAPCVEYTIKFKIHHTVDDTELNATYDAVTPIQICSMQPLKRFQANCGFEIFKYVE